MAGMGLGNFGIMNMPTTGETRNITEVPSERHLPDMVFQVGKMHQVTVLQDAAHGETVLQVVVPQEAVQGDAVL